MTCQKMTKIQKVSVNERKLEKGFINIVPVDFSPE